MQHIQIFLCLLQLILYFAATTLKRLASILLLLLLLFNFVGYRFVFDVLQQKATNELVSNLDNDKYKGADLVTITVPLSMPYLTDSKDFERKDGEITIDGKIYHYVKQKISQGNLVLMCLPDEHKMQIQSAKDEFFKLVNELQNNNSSSKKSGENSIVLKLVISNYDKLQTTALNNIYSTRIASTLFTNAFSFALQKGNGITPEQPPEA